MVQRVARFTAAWVTLSVIVNLRFPGDETKFSYLWPSLDVALVVGLYAFLAVRGLHAPRWLRPLLVAFFVSARVLRLGDGIQQNYFHRPFNLYLDLRLVPDLVRLFWSTTSHGIVLLGIVAFVLGFVGLAYGVRWALREIEVFVAVPAQRSWFAGVALLLVVLSPFGPRAQGDEQFIGMYAASVAPRLGEEADFLLHVSGYREARLREVHAVGRRLQESPHSLERLNSAKVLMFVVESYGVTVFDPKLASKETDAALDQFESSLRERGYTLASGLLDSPVYGGSSWLAQATLATAVQTNNEFLLALLKAEQPVTLADFFRRAGYRTVLVQPGTTRAWPEQDLHHFDVRYASFDLDYRGPRFSWASMPDQYVLDAIHRREVEKIRGPLFVEYALVSSHAPWSEQPHVVDDWDSVGNGEVFNRLPKVRFDTSLVGSQTVREAYLCSIRYDLAVLGRYLTERLTDDTLVFVLGDHQPIPEATNNSARHAVPLHVISRSRALVDAWLARGYRPALRPDFESHAEPLASFLPTLLEALSLPHAGAHG